MDEFKNRAILFDDESYGPLLPIIKDRKIKENYYNVKFGIEHF